MSDKIYFRYKILVARGTVIDKGWVTGMLINEVASSMGLSEDTIRFYIEKRLLSPSTYMEQGREIIELSETDVVQLQYIVNMRKASFELEEVKDIILYNYKLAETVKKWYVRIKEEPNKYEEFIFAFQEVDILALQNMKQIDSYISKPASKRNLPILDKEPYFKSNDFISKEEKNRNIAQMYNKNDTEYKTGKMIVTIITVLVVISMVIDLIQTVNIISFVVNLIIVACLYFGFGWARIVTLILRGLAIVIIFAALTRGDLSLVQTSDIIMICVMGVFNVICCYLLLFNKAVKEFLYSQRY